MPSNKNKRNPGSAKKASEAKKSRKSLDFVTSEEREQNSETMSQGSGSRSPSPSASFASASGEDADASHQYGFVILKNVLKTL